MIAWTFKNGCMEKGITATTLANGRCAVMLGKRLEDGGDLVFLDSENPPKLNGPQGNSFCSAAVEIINGPPLLCGPNGMHHKGRTKEPQLLRLNTILTFKGSDPSGGSWEVEKGRADILAACKTELASGWYEDALIILYPGAVISVTPQDLKKFKQKAIFFYKGGLLCENQSDYFLLKRGFEPEDSSRRFRKELRRRRGKAPRS